MIAIGSDHGGFQLKQAIMKHLAERGLDYNDVGCYDEQSCDYPIFARLVAKEIMDGNCGSGILICSTGIGISIAANKVPGIRAALCHDCFSAEATRQHNDANILCMGGAIIDVDLAVKIVDVFLDTPFSGDTRHVRRIHMIE
jgi:ribose 5-phosphate isomerase B